jgi:hypothetical protein
MAISGSIMLDGGAIIPYTASAKVMEWESVNMVACKIIFLRLVFRKNTQRINNT